MDKATKIAAIRRRLERAKDDLETARVDLAAEKWRGAANRAYYAAFHFASAALLWHDQARTKHSGVESAFSDLLIRTGLIEREYFRIYLDARTNREQQDYEMAAPPLAEEKARKIVADAERFVARIERYLREAGAVEDKDSERDETK
ncbi:MAG: HEPN domain-containing protein [Chloroflexi bacterium]|nr:HEPN domain-containing protein [Chloroflexota bacterium]